MPLSTEVVPRCPVAAGSIDRPLCWIVETSLNLFLALHNPVNWSVFVKCRGGFAAGLVVLLVAVLSKWQDEGTEVGDAPAPW